MARHLLEESHELLEAIDGGDSDAIRDELGDLLLQVVFHAQMASEDGRWDIDDVARGLVEGSSIGIRTCSGTWRSRDPDEVLTNWERLKAEEGSKRSAVDDDIPVTLPALARGEGATASRRLGGPVAERRIGHRLAPRGVRAARRRTG